MLRLISFAFLVVFIFFCHQLHAKERLHNTTFRNSGLRDSRIKDAQPCSVFAWRENVWTTTFWIGQPALRSVPGSSCNKKSAWERNWVRTYGGYDHPTRRKGYRPAAFIPKQNSFYVALPYNDLTDPEQSAKWVPWWKPGQGRWTSQLKGRWLAIERNGRTAYAQWKDVGPWVTHDPDYVFGGKHHRGKAGLDVSPAVRDYIGLNGSGYTRWRFVEEHEVPEGPWLDFGDVRQKVLAAREQKGSSVKISVSQNNLTQSAARYSYATHQRYTRTAAEQN